ncbi:MAG: hypothetical protein HRU34_03250 [Richelia sp.]|nr:hypothetical protein [Richelia sp.]CDN11251.1 hypothetical protein RintRC_5306 [Richelia intracellularis]
MFLAFYKDWINQKNHRYYEKNGDLNFTKAEDYTPEQVEKMKKLVNPILIAMPPKGKNTAIVGWS